MKEISFNSNGDVLLPHGIAYTNPSKEELVFATGSALEAIQKNPEHCGDFWFLTLLAIVALRAGEGRFCKAEQSAEAQSLTGTEP